MTDSSSQIFLGSMTGTSLDGMDLVAVMFEQDKHPQLLYKKFIAYPDDLKQQLKSLCQSPDAKVSDCCQTDSWLGEFYADSINQFLSDFNLPSSKISALGSHGQTIRHNVSTSHPYTLQIGDPNIITARTGLKVVADFRRKDLALGGQGAPLAPAFHQQVFHSPKHNRVILNIGGIANITYLPADISMPVIGFDTGPGNTLIDQVCQQRSDFSYDKDGKLARSGNIIKPLLTSILEKEPYFNKAYPKSTGTDYFSPSWLSQFDTHATPTTDLLATITELTAVSISKQIQAFTVKPSECFVCGGGAHNAYLLERIASHLDDIKLDSTIAAGIDPDWVEAMAFAWLAKQTLNNEPGNLPSVTNAQYCTILGGVFQ